ncbi:uncharacterized protein LOC110986100 [Acanthaster planci]|uniref:Uncharacterized protein LOC110986100 n=1 Tax=Acanthaster planci TaxID=133434 RepID=A0A8B7ZEK9_ACAPL|nr:uncharacterized protein LOC110986100 [Acanthaster planci]
MNWLNEAFFVICCVYITMSTTVNVATAQNHHVTAYMDRRERNKEYGCGDVVGDTVSGAISSVIPANAAGLNCSLTLISPPGTRLSLTITRLHLVSPNLNTCDGNRLKILGGEASGAATSLLPSFPNGLCGYTKPSQSVESLDNRVYLLLESIPTTIENTFNLSYESFKTTPDDECFVCDVGGSRSEPFCIDPRLLCDGRQNCPGNSEETAANCMATTSAPPSGSGSIVVIVIVSVLAAVLIAVMIFVVLAVMAKRMRSKRNQGSVRRSERASQSLTGAPPSLAVNLDHMRLHGENEDLPGSYEVAVGSPMPLHPLGGPPLFTVDGEYRSEAPPGTAGPLPGAPPAYSTLPRPMERSLQIAENTNPISRSRVPSTNDELAPGTP